MMGAFVAGLLVLIAVAPSGAAAKRLFVAHDLGTLGGNGRGAVAMTEYGEVVGNSDTASGAPVAAQTTSATGTPLIVVYLENQGLDQLLNQKADVPYLYSLWTDPSVEQFTQFYSVEHGSFSDYAALAVGYPLAPPSVAGQYSQTTLWNQLSDAATPVSWGVYEESEPSTCYPGSYRYDTTGPYKIGHNPAMPFNAVYPGHTTSTCANVKLLSALNPSNLPEVSFVTPNLCDDMHGVSASEASSHHYVNCVTGTAALLRRGDSWLKDEVGLWTRNGTRDVDVLITFDEGDGTDHTGVGSAEGGGHIYTVLLGPGVIGGDNNAQYNAYNLLAGIEEEHNLTPRLGNAASATPIALP